MNAKLKLVLYLCALLYIMVGFVNHALASPTLTTGTATQVNATFATANGSLDNLDGDTITQHGFVWSLGNTAPEIGPSATPILQYKMNDIAGNTAVTDSAGSNTGYATRNTSTISTSGKIGTGFTFNSANSDYIYTTTQYTNPTTFTISAWFKTTSTDARKIVGFENQRIGQSSTSYDRQVYMSSDGRVKFGWYASGYVIISSAAGYNDGNWHHVVATYSSGNGELYVDGQSQGTDTGTAASYSGYWRIGSYKLGSTWGGSDGYFTGALDDVRIYNTALSSADVAILYNGGSGTEVTAAGSNMFNQLGTKGSTGSFNSQISGLIPNTTYYVRAYATGSTSGTVYASAQNFATTNSGYVTWLGTSSTAWSTGSNWSGGTAPTSGDEVVINGYTTNAPTIDLSSGAITVKALSIGASNPSTLTFANADTDTKKLIITNDIGIGYTGIITHTANTNAKTHVVNFSAANLSVYAGGKIDVSAKGYAKDEGSGQGTGTNGLSSSGGGYGGGGGDSYYGIIYNGGSTYGSVTEPADLGSGGGTNSGGAGGGAIKMVVSGTANVMGYVYSQGEWTGSSSTGGGGSGGSVWIDAGTILGSDGIVSANGGSGYASNYDKGGGGGGRIAFYYATDSSSFSVRAYGGEGGPNNFFGGAGTIYKKPSGQDGNLIIDNHNINSSDHDRYCGQTQLSSTLTFNTITVQNYGNLNIGSSANITYSTLNWSTKGIITDDGGTFALVSSGVGLTVPATATLNANTERTFTGVTVNGTISAIGNKDTDLHKINLTINGDLTVNSGGSINANSKGYGFQLGPGAGVYGGLAQSGSGGGYGGQGGRSSVSGSAGNKGVSYGSLSEPSDSGSGGGYGYSTALAGAGGGGAIKMIVSGTATLNSADITANGESDTGGGGGSGGSIWLTTGTLAGSGTISASGGNGASGGGGGGGGGRIAVYYTTDNSTSIAYQSYGGTGYYFGGAGTIYKKPSGLDGDLVVDNNNQNPGTSDVNYGLTPIDGTYTFNTLTVQNYGFLDIASSTDITYSTLNWSTKGILADSGGTFALFSGGGSLTVPSTAILYGNTARTLTGLTINGTLTHSINSSSPQYLINYTVNGDCLISGEGIDVSYKGYETGLGPGAGNSESSAGNGGASHGGNGGRGGGVAAGLVYDSITEPVDLGSGGGEYSSVNGGAGGGAVKLVVTGTTTISADIHADGGNYTGFRAGGGSGGSVFISTNILSGTGATISSNGGEGEPSYGGGGGGGGRIAVHYTTDSSSSITYQAYGGAGWSFGGAGTVYIEPSGQSGSLIIDNNNQDPWDDRYNGKTDIGNISVDTLTVQNYGYLDVNSASNISYNTLNWSSKGIIADNGGAIGLIKDNNSLTIPSTARLVGNKIRTFSGLTVNGTLTHSSNGSSAQYALNYIINGDCLISGTGIDVHEKGYQSGSGTGAGTIGNATGNSGGSYGGKGGRGATNDSGSTYGSATSPNDIGSGGSYFSTASSAGAGGGAAKIIVSGTTTISSSINSNGGNYTGNLAGGGSGGSIWLDTNILSGTGSVSSNGGTGSSTNGGGGGGGRIAIYANTNNATLSSVIANGNSGYRIGNPGTIVFNKEFNSVVDPGQGAGYDYPSLFAWEAATNSDLTLASTKTYLHTGVTGAIADGTTVTGATSAKKAELIHATSSQILVKNTRTLLGGTASFISGSTAVVGIGTTFTTMVAEGEYIWNENDKNWLQVQTVTDNTHLLLASSFSGTSGSAPIYARKGSFTSGEQVRKDASNYVTISDTGLGAIALATCRTSTGVADTTPVVIDGWTSSAENYIKIWTNPAENYRHHGKWDNSKYRLEVNDSTGNTNAIFMSEDYGIIDGLQIKISSTQPSNGYVGGITVGGGDMTVDNSDVRVSNNIIKGSGTVLGSILGIDAFYRKTEIWNNLIYDLAANSSDGSVMGIQMSNDTGPTFIRASNNTVYNVTNIGAGTGVGYRSRDDNTQYVLKNNLAYSCEDNYSGIYDASSTNNLSGPGSDADMPTTNGKNGVTVMFADSGNSDFHLAANDQSARYAGTNLSNDTNLAFQDDIDGDGRAGDWSIGADEYTGAASSDVVEGGIHTIGMSLNDKMTSGLVGMWSFNGPDIIGGTAMDTSGQNNHGTIVGATRTIGRMNQGLNFINNTDGVTFGSSAQYINTGAPFSVSFWTYMNNIDNSYPTLITLKSDTTRPWHILFSKMSGVEGINIGSNLDWAKAKTDTSEADLIGKWHNITVTYNGSGATTISNFQIYLDGSAQTLSEVTANYGFFTNVNRFCGIDDTGNYKVDGKLDEVRIYNRALSVDEVGDLYRLGHATISK